MKILGERGGVRSWRLHDGTLAQGRSSPALLSLGPHTLSPGSGGLVEGLWPALTLKVNSNIFYNSTISFHKSLKQHTASESDAVLHATRLSRTYSVFIITLRQALDVKSIRQAEFRLVGNKNCKRKCVTESTCTPLASEECCTRSSRQGPQRNRVQFSSKSDGGSQETDLIFKTIR